MARIVPDYDLKVNSVSIKGDKVVKRLSVSLPVNSQASSFSATLYNENGNWTNYFDYHDDIEVYLGYETEGTVGLFHGRIERVQRTYRPSGSEITISGRGMWVKLMEKFTVREYASTDYGDIIIAEIADLVTGITTTNVVDAGIAPAEEFLDHVFLSDMVTNYCSKAQYFSWVDFDDDLHFTGTPGANTVSIDSGENGNVEEITMDIDWKSVRNYIRAYGKTVEEIVLFKTEQDDTSVGKYGKIMKLVKDAGMDTTSLVQSVADATLLTDKESEWGGMAILYGDERIEPGKTITLNVPEIGESSTSYRVQNVQHSLEPTGSGFKTTVMLVEEEKNTARFYKELYEKTQASTEMENAGNYNESYVYKFTKDQDALWTFSNCFTTDSYLRVGSTTAAGTATLTSSIVGDKNYTKCLPFVREEFPGNAGNKYYASNDGGSTWEELFPFGATDDLPVEHTFASSTGDKNDLKFKAQVEVFDALIHGTKTDEVIAYRPENYVSFYYTSGWTFKEYWRYNSPWGGMPYGVAFDKDKKLYLSTGDKEIYSVDVVSGMNGKLEATLTINLGGMWHDGTNLYVLDRTNERISKRNSADLTTEDSYEALPAGAGTACWGLGQDGTSFIFTSQGDGATNSANSIWAKNTATQRFPIWWYFGGSGTYAHTGAGYNSVNGKYYAVRDSSKYLMEFNSDLQTISAALNMETVCGTAGYQPQSACDDNVTLWSTNTDGTTNRIAKHTAGSYGTAAAATYDFAESTYGKFVGICFDGTDLWVLSRLGTYGTFYRINTSGVIQATHTITSTNSTGNLWADCEWDGSNLYATYTTKGTTNRDKVLYKFNATPTTIATELQIGHMPYVRTEYDGTIGRGLAWNGSNFVLTWYWPDYSVYGSWFKLGNEGDYGAITGAWYPYDCCSDGTYIWFIQNTAYTDKILRSTGEAVDSLSTFEFAYGLDYAAAVTSSKVYTFGAYLKLDY